MLILGQNGDLIANLDRINSITTYKIGACRKDKNVDDRCRILAWYGNGENDCWGLGDYETEERAKEIVREILNKYGEYFYRQGVPALLKGTSDIPEAFLIPPKIYEMPQT